MHRGTMMFVFLCFVGSALWATEITTKGQVKDANTYAPVPNVNIYLASIGSGTTTDDEGKFSLRIVDPRDGMKVVFEHVAFDTLILPLIDVLDNDVFYLQPRIIQMPEISVEAEKVESDITKDIPIAISVVQSKQFDIQGYVDAGDLLKTEQSVQIDEQLTGEKKISIRAGNPEDVVIMYDGIKMNDIYDNTFDLSLINLEDIKQVEIIKGSNTALYGPDAFSGVVNFIPKSYRNYFIRASQRFGTYNSGDWNVQLNHNCQNQFNLSYNYKQGASKKRYVDEPDNTDYVENKLFYNTAGLVYLFRDADGNLTSNQVSGNYIDSKTNYKDHRYNESIDNQNQLGSLRYQGDIGFVTGVNLVAAYQRLLRDEILNSDNNSIRRHFDSSRRNLDVEKTINFYPFTWLVAYQYEDGRLSFTDLREPVIPVGIESASYRTQKHGAVAIMKLHTPTGSDVIQAADIDFSYRYDLVDNKPQNIIYRETGEEFNPIGETRWDRSTLKFAANLSGLSRTYRFNGYFNYGTNVKFPTLYQQISIPRVFDPSAPGNFAALNPESNRGLDIGLELARETDRTTSLFGWEIQANYFMNYYENKFRVYQIPGLPVSFYDNVATADISGLEARMTGYFLKKKLTIDFGISDYSISDKSAFPFKYDNKQVANIYIDHAGFSIQVHWFREGDQVALIRDRSGEYLGLVLPGHQNIDIHFSKMVELFSVKLLANFSARNLLEDDTALEGIAIRDRRFYLTFGFEY